MTNDVEVVAKAIAESYYGISWDSTEEVDKNVWRKQAHAAIAALGGHELTRVREDIDRTASVVQALGTAIIASRQCHASWHRLEYEAHEQWERLVDLLEQQRAMESPAKPAPQPEQQPGLSHVAAHFADEQGATAPQPEQPQRDVGEGRRVAVGTYSDWVASAHRWKQAHAEAMKEIATLRSRICAAEEEAMSVECDCEPGVGACLKCRVLGALESPPLERAKGGE